MTDKRFAIVELQPFEQLPANTFAWGGDLLIREFWDAQAVKRSAAAALARADSAAESLAEREERLKYVSQGQCLAPIGRATHRN
jgi:hypothetical protein